MANNGNPTLQRLTGEARALQRNPDPNIIAGPAGDDLLLWHFTIRGAPDTPFEGGIYHGKIIFPPQYPMKPPDIYFLTPNGRFETNKKLCLTITSYHPDTWNPAWDVRTALTSLIAFMVTKGDGAIGAIDTNDNERRKLALQSQSWHCDDCDLELPPLPDHDVCPRSDHDVCPRSAEEEPPEPPPVDDAAPADEVAEVAEVAEVVEAGPDGDEMVHLSYDEMRIAPLRTRSTFIPLLDIPIVTLFGVLVFLIANSQFHFVQIFASA
jgi:ubiquitin-conjugating enzyme E2 J1